MTSLVLIVAIGTNRTEASARLPATSRYLRAVKIRTIKAGGRDYSVRFDSSSAQLCIGTDSGVFIANIADRKGAVPVAGLVSPGTISVLTGKRQFGVFREHDIFEIVDGKVTSTKRVTGDWPNFSRRAYLSPDGRFLGIERDLETSEVLDAQSSKVLSKCEKVDWNEWPRPARLRVALFSIHGITYLPDYGFATFCGQKGPYHWIDLKCQAAPQAEVYCEVTSTYISSCDDKRLRSWYLPGANPVHTTKPFRQPASTLAVSPDGELLGYGELKSFPWRHPGNTGYGLLFIDIRHGWKVVQIDRSAQPYDIAFSKDGKYVAEADRRGFVRLYLLAKN